MSKGLLTLAVVLIWPPLAAAQVATAPAAMPPATSGTGTRLGIDVFGGAGIGFPAAKDSYDALGLRTTPFEIGGGARVTGLWRKLFAQVAVTRWSDDGERAFVDSEGNIFPLGIPLSAEATFIDASVGVKDAIRNSSGRVTFLTYVGGGAGTVRYRESSPFAESGDDLDTSKPSYHFLVGVEVPLVRWLALAVDGRFRYIPGVLGDGGTSGALEQDSLGGFQTSAALRIGFGGPQYLARTPPAQPPATTPSTPMPPITPGERLPQGEIVEAAPVFLLPDASRTPLRTLPPGTPFRVLEQKDDWIRIEFNDVQYGRRVGYVQRKYVRVNR